MKYHINNALSGDQKHSCENTLSLVQMKKTQPKLVQIKSSRRDRLKLAKPHLVKAYVKCLQYFKHMLEHTGCIITFIALTTKLELIVQGSPCSKELKFRKKQRKS